MRVNIRKDDRVEQALAGVNGQATEHTYTKAQEIRQLAGAAERELERLGLPKKYRRGARLTAVSGKDVPNSYGGWWRVGTKVVLERITTSWQLTEVEPAQIGTKATAPVLALTAKQDSEVVRRTRLNYCILKEAAG